MSEQHPSQKVGYARVSSSGQSLDVQTDKLRKAGCHFIYSEKVSGLEQNRPQLIECLHYVRKGDTLVITKLDRMARSVLHLNTIVQKLKEKDVNLVVLDQKIDTTAALGKLTFNMVSSFAEFENDLRKERQIDGIKKAQQKGVKFGRPFKVTADIVIGVKENKDNGIAVSDTISEFKISRRTYYTIMKGAYDYLLDGKDH
ncbi:recombinase family protein [Cysteiniphilum sp. QT6929]|uniref:recombinase family protein n=1 Tax=Cysteiniphilum sp. QT6929 TaxID=2975055 RepID=UPI0024B34BFF|nr:recombinase family protein [Cysteiniphilum sp. QT6929]WHN66771.1 recombinase family protein [Cysteiniphilum sp. QT6929]